MSSGPFIAAKYETNSGDIQPIRIQPETVTTWNPQPAGAVNIGLRARATGSPRRYGTTARIVYGVWTTAPAGYEVGSSVRVPILTPTAFDSIRLDASLAYNGGTIRVTGRRNENLR